MAVKSMFAKQGERSNRLECGTCKQRFWMTCKYIDHIAQHKNFVFSCNICTKRFSGQKQLDEHYVTHKEVNTYDCKECNRKFLQKSELDQHKRFHIKLLSSSESPEKIKKVVRFSSTVESRPVDDEFSSTSSYLKERLMGPNGEGTTRSGRTVKIKRFDDGPQVKHRSSENVYGPQVKHRSSENVDGPQVKRRCSENVITKASVNVKDVEQSPVINPASKIPPAVLSTLAKDVFKKKLVVLCEKLPDHVFKMFNSKLNTCTLDSSKDQKSINKLVSSNSETESSNVSNSGKLSKNFNQKQFLTKNSKFSVMHLDEHSSNISTLKDSDCQASINDKHCRNAGKSPSQLSIKPAQTNSQMTGKKNNEVRSQPSLSNKNATFSSTQMSPRVDKHFMYVGPKQDINKIKTVIEEVITITPVVQNKEASKEKSYGLSPSKNGEGSRKANDSNSLNKNSNKRESGEKEIPELKPTDGILEKTVVKDFIFIKVTPELMEKMQKENLGLSPNIHRSPEPFNKADPESISPKTPRPNKISHTARKRKTSKVSQTENLVPSKRKDGNSEPSTVNTPAEVYPVTDKITTSQLVTKVQREVLVFPQKSPENLKSCNVIKPSISPVSSNLNKNEVKEVLCTTGGIGTPLSAKKIPSETSESRTTTNAKNLSPVSLDFNENVKKVAKNITPESKQIKPLVSQQISHSNLKSLTATKPTNILPVSPSLDKNFSEVSQTGDKNAIPNSVKTPVSPRRALDSSVVKILPASSNLNEDLCHTVENNETSEMQRKTAICSKTSHRNVGLATKTTDCITVSPNSIKDLSKVSHAIGKDETPQADTSVHRNSKSKLGSILSVVSNLNTDVVSKNSDSAEKRSTKTKAEDVTKFSKVISMPDVKCRNLRNSKTIVPANLNIDVSKNSDNAEKRGRKTKVEDVTKFHKVISMPNIKYKNLKNSETKVTAVNNNKAKSNDSGKEGCIQIKSTQSEPIDPRIKEKLLERYKAKIEEKERKKKEKYEWKKKMRYVEKMLCSQKKPELPNSSNFDFDKSNNEMRYEKNAKLLPDSNIRLFF